MSRMTVCLAVQGVPVGPGRRLGLAQEVGALGRRRPPPAATLAIKGSQEPPPPRGQGSRVSPMPRRKQPKSASKTAPAILPSYRSSPAGRRASGSPVSSIRSSRPDILPAGGRRRRQLCPGTKHCRAGQQAPDYGVDRHRPSTLIGKVLFPSGLSGPGPAAPQAAPRSASPRPRLSCGLPRVA
jgi:hypothetical protein